MQFLHSLRHVALHGDTRTLEMYLGVVGIAWGAMVASPFWNTFATSPAFALMAALFPLPTPVREILWGCLAILLGLSRLLALGTTHIHARMAATKTAFLFWLIIAVLLGIPSGFLSTGPVIYGLMALASAYVYVRLARIDQQQKIRRGLMHG